MPSSDAQTKLNQALARLEAQYGQQTRYSSKQPMEQLISTILSQRTTYADERRAFRQMWDRYGSWSAIAAADVEELTRLIAPSNYPEVKAPRIQQVIQQVEAERGNFDLAFLSEWEPESAMQWLMRLPGVGYKTATFLLLFVFRQPVLPVDTHVHRVSQRLGLISPKTTKDQAHRLLPELLPRRAADLLNFHKLFFKHGQRVCRWSQPACPQCQLQDLCAAWQQGDTSYRG
jgi:endonuclease III